MELDLTNCAYENPYYEEVECEVIPSFCEETERGRVILNDTQYLEFLEEYGFRTYRDGNAIKLILIRENIIYNIIPKDVKDFIVDYATKYGSQEVKNYLLRTKTFFTMDYLNALKEEKPQLIRDAQHKAFFFYGNGVIEVTKEGISAPIPYNQLEQVIWADKINNREFRHDAIGMIEESIFFNFLCKLTNNDQGRINSIFTIIGYALHNFRSRANTRAIILNDEIVSDTPEGGNGKSLLVTSLGYIRTLVEKNGKNFDPNKSFEWSDISESTDLVLIDETSDRFSFESLFSLITSGFEVEKKNVNKYRLPLEKSPLIIITTNKIIQGYSGSFKRRQYSVDISNFFSNKHTPIDEYGKAFFEEWDDDEWAKFDALMLYCVNYYLANGVIETTESLSRKKDAIRAANETFVEWICEVIGDFQYFTPTNTAIERYKEDTGQPYLKISARTFLRYLNTFCKIYGYQFNAERTSEQRGFYISSAT